MTTTVESKLSTQALYLLLDLCREAAAGRQYTKAGRYHYAQRAKVIEAELHGREMEGRA